MRFIFLFLFFALLLTWILAWTVFHVAGGLIHLVLIFAVLALILHFFMGRRSAKSS